MLCLVEHLSECLRDKLAAVGGIVVLYVLIRLTRAIVHNYQLFVVAPKSPLAINLQSLGSWAVVTGATDGIGKQYALKLAKEGLNIVLVSRSQEKLNNVAKEIEAAAAVKTRCIVADFRGELEVYEKISAELADLNDVAVLVNSVGIAMCPDTFLSHNDTEIKDSIIINCFAVTFMTKMLLPRMIERGRGLIINLSSLAGVLPTPLSAVYGATKAYVDFFSRSVHAEYSSKGVIVQCVLPSVVSTAINNYQPQSLAIPDAVSYVDASFATIGRTTRTAGSLVHTIFMWFLTIEKPHWIDNFVASRVMSEIRDNVRKHRTKSE